MKKDCLRSSIRPQSALTGAALASALWLLSASCVAQAQNLAVTAQQRATAQQTAQQGVSLSELAPNAPDEYTVKRGDTLWGVSRVFLKSPWRWPQLWGMNLQEIANPHRIYPGQVLFLDRSDGRARLGLRGAGGGTGTGGGTIKLSPRTRAEAASDLALPTINPNLVEAFLSEPEILDDEAALTLAPRIVAGNDNRVLLTRGDRAYARGPDGAPLLLADGPAPQLRVFRTAAALKDPGTGEILGYEAQYLGKVRLERSESSETQMRGGESTTLTVPATVDVVAAREEIRAGDRLLPEPARQLVSYAPRAPQQEITNGRIVSVYGNAVSHIGQNQIVTINKGRRDGIESGHVLAILKNGETIIDRTGVNKETLKLPNERAGLLMVFRTFEKASYALVLEISNTPRAGDLLANP